MDTLTPAGTLMMYAGWEDIPNFLDELPADLQQHYQDHHPPFDPALARAVRENGILVEFLRTWTGVQRSLNPEASMVAWGAQAVWLTQDHPLDYGYGSGSPLAKLVEAQGKVILLGSPLSRVTLLHHAEYRARLRHKNIIRYRCPIWRDSQTVWVEIEDYETGEPHDHYSFRTIMQDYLAAGKGQAGQIGAATSYLFDAADLTQFALEWLEARFGVAI
jgi:aminoglycoside 3-N-acetyltransferase